MRKLLIVLVLLTATAARASGGAVIMIPLALAAALIGAVTAPFKCHPQREKLDLEVVSIEIDGAAVASMAPSRPYYVSAYEPGKIVAALVDPSSDPPGAAREHALVLPERP
jgi:hypothetical protein